MILKYTDSYVFAQTQDHYEQRVLERYLNANRVKAGWRLPYHIWTLRALVKAFPDLKHNAELIQRGFALKEQQDRLLSIRQSVPPSFGVPLREYQAQDAAYLSQLTHAGVFSEPRTGKTPVIITVLRHLNKRKNLIVCPASLIWNWVAELEKWWKGVQIVPIVGTAKQRAERYDSAGQVFVISKDTLKSDISKIKPFDVCVVDEAHFLRNYKTAQSKAVYAVKAKHRYALTGTPTVKHPSDIFGILKFLQPETYTSYWQFVDRYFEVGTDWMGHNVVGEVKKHREQELQELIGFSSVQRKRREVMPWLPAKTRTTFHCKMEGKQKKLYDDMRKTFAAEHVDAQNVITQMMRMRQLCLDPRLLGFDVRGVKTDALLEFIENHPQPLIIVSWFTSYLKLLQQEIAGARLLTGEQTSTEKAQAARDFQAGKTNVLLCNVISAGTGFTLDRAENIIFLDKPFTPAELEQAEDRICPTTEERNHKHEITTFECLDSVDARINRILDTKKSLTDFINEGGAAAIRRLLA